MCAENYFYLDSLQFRVAKGKTLPGRGLLTQSLPSATDSFWVVGLHVFVFEVSRVHKTFFFVSPAVVFQFVASYVL